MLIATEIAAVLGAARALNDAVRPDEALALLGSLQVDNEQDELAILIATAEIAARRDWLLGRRSAPNQPLDVALALAARTGVDEVTAWDLEMLQVRRAYADALVRPDGTVWIGPDGREPAAVEDLAERARVLHETAPDAARRGWAAMSRGWIADNLAGDREASAAYFTEALALGREADDWKLIFDAHRHLGDHLRDGGDLDAVRAVWQKSADAAARAGHVTGVLAQQLLLAELAHESGDIAGSVLLATETQRWAAAIGATRLVAEADSLLSTT